MTTVIAFLIIVYVLIVATDFVVWRRVCRRHLDGWRRRVYAGFTTLSDALPLLSWLVNVLLPDNTPAVVVVSMWMNTLYIISVLPRMVWYMFLPFRRHKFVRIAAVATATAVAAIPIYGVFFGRKNIEVKSVDISSERLPDSFDGFRILLFSDLHIGTMLCPDSEIATFVETANAQKADMVIFTGDLVSIRHTELDERRMKMLSGITVPYGVWASIGNHDTGIYVKDTVALPKLLNKELLLDKIEAMGWRIADDSTVYIRRGNDSVSLSGISFSERLYEMRHSAHMEDVDISDVYEGVPAHIYNITMSHLPQLWDNIIAGGYGDLTLSGHVHSMQTKVRVAGMDISPARIFYRRWSGLYEQNGHSLYINDGIGCVGACMRIGASPEITVITLHKSK